MVIYPGQARLSPEINALASLLIGAVADMLVAGCRRAAAGD